MSKKVNAFSIAGAFLFMVSLCFVCPYLSDDWHFKFVFYDFMPIGFDKPVGNVRDIAVSMANYYNLSGGRVFAHLLLYIADLFPKVVFDIINAAVFAAFGDMLLRLVKRCAGRVPAYSLPLIYLSMILFLPSFGESAVWMSGAVNYLWMGVVITSFLLCIPRNITKANPLRYTAVCVLAFLSGAANEVSGGMLLVLSTFYMYLYRSHKAHISKKQIKRVILPAVFLLLGMFIVLLAPGNAERAVIVDKTEIFSLHRFFSLLPHIISWYAGKYLPLTAVMLLANLFFWDGSRSVCCAVSFFAAGAAGLAALPLSGSFIERSAFTPVIFLLISFFISSARLLRKLKDGFVMPSFAAVKVSVCLGIVLILFFIFMQQEMFSISVSLTALCSLATFAALMLCGKTVRTGYVTKVMKVPKKLLKCAVATVILCVCLYIGRDFAEYLSVMSRAREAEKSSQVSSVYKSITDNLPENIFIPHDPMLAYNYGFLWKDLYCSFQRK